MALTLIFWAFLGLTLWVLLTYLEDDCRLRNAHNGLWAECFAPAASIFIMIYVVGFVLELIRTTIAYRGMRPSEG